VRCGASLFRHALAAPAAQGGKAIMIALTIALAVVVGITLGMLGGGGSTLTVPLLAFVAGLDARRAITTALLVVGVTSAIGAFAHARAARVQWRAAVLLGLTGMAGAYVGGRLAQYVPGRISMVAFAAIMFVSASAMLRGRRNTVADPARNLPIVKTAVLGAAVGVVSGLTGAGGGFLLVAALALFGGLAMPIAVGTSLIVIAMHCAAALAGRLEGEHIQWRLAVLVTIAAVIGSLVGERLTAMIDPHRLRMMFGWSVLPMPSVILARETNPVLGAATAALTLAAVGFYLIRRRRDVVRWVESLPAARITFVGLFRRMRDYRRIPRWAALKRRRVFRRRDDLADLDQRGVAAVDAQP